MNDKEFTDYLFKIMYELGYRKAEVIKEGVFFYKDNTLMSTWTPRVPTKCTCFEDKYQCIDIAEYIGIIDWDKVKVDTPIYVREYNGNIWEKRHFAFFKDGKVYAWLNGVTSWTAENTNYVFSWKHAKLAEV